MEEQQSPLPYAIRESEELGRYLIANKDLELGEVIFEEYPIATGLVVQDPDSADYDWSKLCVECYKETASKCAGCGFPICEPDNHDPRLPKEHGALECDLLLNSLKSAGQQCKNDTQPGAFMATISSQLFFIRCLLLGPEEAKKFRSLEANYAHWCKSKLAKQFQEQVVLLRWMFGSVFEFSDNLELSLVKARQDINSYEIRLASCSIQAVYGLASMLEHNCVPNTHRSTQSHDLKLIVRAAHNIAKGSHLSLSYSDLFWTTPQRQKDLRDTKFFTCSCSRCTDPTECGTLLSALVCPRCSTCGVDNPMLPVFTKGKDFRADFIHAYSCISCGLAKERGQVRRTVKSAKRELELIESICNGDNESDDEGEAIHNFMDWLHNWTTECFLNKIKPTGVTPCRQTLDGDLSTLRLHPQNSLVLDVCHTIFLLLPITNEPMKDEELRLKIKLGKHLLNTMSPIAQGLSKFRCTVSNDLAHAEVILAIRNANGKLANSPLRDTVFGTLKIWKEVLDCLKFEPMDTSEGVLCQNGFKEYQKYISLLS